MLSRGALNTRAREKKMKTPIMAMLSPVVGGLLLACSSPGSADGDDGLGDTDWKLSSLAGHAVSGGPSATLHFADGKLYGSDGCNRFHGSYAATEDHLQITGKLASTMMACPEPVMRQATAFSNALRRATGFRRDGRQLLLLDGAGNPLATFNAQAHGISGSAWRVTAYNNGKQAVVSLLAGSTLTLGFADDGRVSGSAGCNNYTASYATQGQSITISPPAATRKRCPQPAGLMEQEALFLQALASGATWRRAGDRLELRTAAGALALSLSAEPGAEDRP